jgi:hypothetical protein
LDQRDHFSAKSTHAFGQARGRILSLQESIGLVSEDAPQQASMLQNFAEVGVLYLRIYYGYSAENLAAQSTTRPNVATRKPATLPMQPYSCPIVQNIYFSLLSSKPSHATVKTGNGIFSKKNQTLYEL